MSTAIYRNSAGIEFDLLDFDLIKLKDAQLHKYEWNPETVKYKFGELLQTFTKDAQVFPATFKVFGSVGDRMEKLNDFHDATEHDIFLTQPGILEVDGYQIECYIIESDTIAPDNDAAETTNEVSIYCPFPFWIKETKYEIEATGQIEVVDGLDFDFDLPCDLGVSGYRKTITFDTTIPLDFRLVIYGPCANPAIYINGHLYEVDITVPTNATLTISSIEKNDREKAVFLTYPSGNTTSALYARNRDSYIFEPIQGAGNIIVSTAQELRFDLYLIEKRSEPKWI